MPNLPRKSGLLRSRNGPARLTARLDPERASAAHPRESRVDSLGDRHAERRKAAHVQIAGAGAHRPRSFDRCPGFTGQTTTGVNLRAGPGTNFPTLQSLTAGAAVDVQTCD